MFVLSKAIWIFCQPFSLALTLCIVCLISVVIGLRQLAICSVLFSILILTVSLFTTCGAVMVQSLEDRFPRPPGGDPSDVKCLIVLGGGFANDVDTFRGGYEMIDAGDRFVEAIRLSHKYPNSRIIVSGGDGFITGGFLGDAVISQRMFSAFGISQSRVLNDATSRTTFENAINTKTLLDANGFSNCLLVTSGFHMPRSVGIFRHLGIEVVPWVVDYRTTGREHLRFDISQPETNASLLAVAMKEWIGMIGYYGVGRTSAIFPAP
ncbi:YdcF family protein [Rhizobium tumorigenes]|uniref:YdcF family protein n=1 Tax=Rhizobium tumorigenes TaxID=2041385 RepID=UPI00241DED4C|nr:YdcF family protein [Rhizobium tumorigenes]WFS03310.1 YdcF family protein [Rhizobium tumorigenes]